MNYKFTEKLSIQHNFNYSNENNHNIYLILLAFLTGLNSCDKDIEQINTNPVLATSLDPIYLFSTAEYSSGVSTLNYQSALVQQILTPFTGVLEGGNHNIVYDPNSNALFSEL